MWPIKFANYCNRCLPFIIIVFLNILFFNLMLLGSEIFMTPDFGRSDIIHGEYASFYFLSEQLESGHFPFWNPYIATGFPVLGTFHPVNVLLLWLLPATAAYNYIYLTIFLTTGIFTYLFCRQINLSKSAALLTSIIFNFSGIMIAQIPHQGILQTLSYFPAQLFFAELCLKKKKRSASIFLSLTIGLQILSGFYQLVLYSLVILGLYSIIRIGQQNISIKSKIFILINLAVSVLLGITLAGVQILPTLQMTAESVRSSGVNIDEISRFPYPLKHLFAFANPYLFGDPRLGTYPPFSADWGIFWESTGYLGILPLFFVFFAITSAFSKDRRILLFILLSILCAMLMLGKNSPLFFIHTIPPFSFFRVPVRWIVFFTFSLSILAGLGFEIIKNALSKINQLKIYKNKLVIIFLSAVTINIMLFAFGYNPRVTADKWLEAPATVDFLKKDRSFFRIATYGNDLFWNNIFVNEGWKNSLHKYLPMLNALEPNSNLLWGLDHSLSYPVLITRRDSAVRFFLQNNIKTEIKNITGGKISGSVKINKIAKKILDMQSVKYLISPLEIEAENISLVFKTKTTPVYNIYRNKTVLPRAYIVGEILTVNQTDGFLKTVPSSEFNPARNAIVESEKGVINLNTKRKQVKIIKSTNSRIELQASLDGRGMLVLADSFYPGWQAEINGVKTEILPANINQRAIFLDKGKHKIVFYFTAEKFRQGLMISIITLLILAVLTTAVVKKKEQNH